MNIIEKLKQFNVEVTPEMEKAFAGDFLSEKEVEKKLSKAESDRDSWKQRAETAEETLKGFDGKDFDTITRERDEWKKKAEDAEKEYSAKEAEREKRGLVEDAMVGIEFTSESAKKAIMAQIYEGVSVKNGKLIGFNDLLEDAKKNDASAFVSKKDDGIKITSGAGGNGGLTGSVLTRKEIDSIKDTRDRQRAIAESLARGDGIYQK